MTIKTDIPKPKCEHVWDYQRDVNKQLCVLCHIYVNIQESTEE